MSRPTSAQMPGSAVGGVDESRRIHYSNAGPSRSGAPGRPTPKVILHPKGPGGVWRESDNQEKGRSPGAARSRSPPMVDVPWRRARSPPSPPRPRPPPTPRPPSTPRPPNPAAQSVQQPGDAFAKFMVPKDLIRWVRSKDRQQVLLVCTWCEGIDELLSGAKSACRNFLDFDGKLAHYYCDLPGGSEQWPEDFSSDAAQYAEVFKPRFGTVSGVGMGFPQVKRERLLCLALLLTAAVRTDVGQKWPLKELDWPQGLGAVVDAARRSFPSRFAEAEPQQPGAPPMGDPESEDEEDATVTALQGVYEVEEPSAEEVDEDDEAATDVLDDGDADPTHEADDVREVQRALIPLAERIAAVEVQRALMPLAERVAAVEVELRSIRLAMEASGAVAAALPGDAGEVAPTPLEDATDAEVDDRPSMFSEHAVKTEEEPARKLRGSVAAVIASEAPAVPAAVPSSRPANGRRSSAYAYPGSH